jgi:ammonia channel protein AmtB
MAVLPEILLSQPATYGLLRFVGVIFPLRSSPEDELADLDISLHGEALQ